MTAPIIRLTCRGADLGAGRGELLAKLSRPPTPESAAVAKFGPPREREALDLKLSGESPSGLVGIISRLWCGATPTSATMAGRARKSSKLGNAGSSLQRRKPCA